MLYYIQRPDLMTTDFIKDLLYKKHDGQYINEELPALLGLAPLTEIKITAQVSGNCAWANVEALIPTLFFLLLVQVKNDNNAYAYYKTLALNFFNRWREWNKDRALYFCIQSYQHNDSIRKACKAEMLAAILYQSCHDDNPNDTARREMILELFLSSPYEYLLKNYVKVYYFESNTAGGKRFFEMLKSHGFKV